MSTGTHGNGLINAVCLNPDHGKEMKALHSLFASPEMYPVILLPGRNIIRFVRMSPATYRDSVFLDLRTRYMDGATCDLRLDDLLLASANSPALHKPVHYVLNTAFCCSTVAARYFELLPSFFVLKEPRLLSQLAVLPDRSLIPWDATLDLCVRLLSRTYEENQMVLIKPVDCCSVIGRLLLERNPFATVTYLITPLRDFLLSVLKSGERREWARTRLQYAFRDFCHCPALQGIDIEELTIPQCAAMVWLIHRYLCEQLLKSECRSRVLLLNGQHLVTASHASLRAMTSLCGLPLSQSQLSEVISHPSTKKYSKDLTRSYDTDSRKREMLDLEAFLREEADAGEEWASRYGWPIPEIDAVLNGYPWPTIVSSLTESSLPH